MLLHLYGLETSVSRAKETFPASRASSSRGDDNLTAAAYNGFPDSPSVGSSLCIWALLGCWLSHVGGLGCGSLIADDVGLHQFRA